MVSDTTRRLMLLRHAKSDWPDVPDRDRPLAKRGRRDAPVIGRWLHDHGYLPDAVVCSAARRTRETWELLAPELGGSPSVTFEPRAYAASALTLLYLVGELPAASRTALLIGHNPAISELATSLAHPPDGQRRALVAGDQLPHRRGGRHGVLRRLGRPGARPGAPARLRRPRRPVADHRGSVHLPQVFRSTMLPPGKRGAPGPVTTGVDDL